MNNEKIQEIFSSTGAIVTDGHFVYTSGRHGHTYINKDAIYVYPTKIAYLCREIAQHFAGDNIEVVVGPATGGIIISTWVAHYLSELSVDNTEVHSVYADKIEKTGKFVIKRGYDKIVPGKNVLVVEDLLTTGGSARKVVDVTRSIDGTVVGVGVLCNRGSVTKEDLGNVPKLFALMNVTLETWPNEEVCPYCQSGRPINTDIGKGADFLEKSTG